MALWISQDKYDTNMPGEPPYELWPCRPILEGLFWKSRDGQSPVVIGHDIFDPDSDAVLGPGEIHRVKSIKITVELNRKL